MSRTGPVVPNLPRDRWGWAAGEVSVGDYEGEDGQGAGVPGFVCQEKNMVEYVVPPGMQQLYHPNSVKKHTG